MLWSRRINRHEAFTKCHVGTSEQRGPYCTIITERGWKDQNRLVSKPERSKDDRARNADRYPCIAGRNSSIRRSQRPDSASNREQVAHDGHRSSCIDQDRKSVV